MASVYAIHWTSDDKLAWCSFALISQKCKLDESNHFGLTISLILFCYFIENAQFQLGCLMLVLTATPRHSLSIPQENIASSTEIFSPLLVAII